MPINDGSLPRDTMSASSEIVAERPRTNSLTYWFRYVKETILGDKEALPKKYEEYKEDPTSSNSATDSNDDDNNNSNDSAPILITNVPLVQGIDGMTFFPGTFRSQRLH